MAKYKNIAREIIGEIGAGKLKPYDQLPTVVELTEKYHVSRSTIEQVMNELERGGFVARKRGSGVYVKNLAAKATQYQLNTISLVDGVDDGIKKVPTCEVRNCTIVKPDEDVAHLLGLHEYGFTYLIERSHVRDGRLVDVQRLLFPVGIFRDIRLDAAESSIHDWIEENYDVSPDSYHKTIRAGSATKEDCEVLSVEEGTPLLEVVQVGYLDDGRPFEYVETKFPGDLSVYQTVDSDSIPV